MTNSYVCRYTYRSEGHSEASRTKRSDVNDIGCHTEIMVLVWNRITVDLSMGTSDNFRIIYI